MKNVRSSKLNPRRALSARLQKVREDERRRLARDVHDELGQALTGLKIDLTRLHQQLTEPAHAAELTRMLGRLEDTLHTVRRIATDLHPRLLDDFGLRAALEWLAEDFQARHRIPCRFVASGAERPRSPERDTALFRIAQESLTNVARHAAATAARISLADERGRCVLAIEDDGVGIPERASTGASLGIIGMRERAAHLGGRLEIVRLSPRGTRVTAWIPVEGAR